MPWGLQLSHCPLAVGSCSFWEPESGAWVAWKVQLPKKTHHSSISAAEGEGNEFTETLGALLSRTLPAELPIVVDLANLMKKMSLSEGL